MAISLGLNYEYGNSLAFERWITVKKHKITSEMYIFYIERSGLWENFYWILYKVSLLLAINKTPLFESVTLLNIWTSDDPGSCDENS